jgi:hypothetical protein
MKRLLIALLCLLCLSLASSSQAQQWTVTGTSTPTSYNNVRAYNLTHPDTPAYSTLYGAMSVLSITTDGAHVTYNLNRGPQSISVGNMFSVVTASNPMNTTTVPTDLLGSCTVTSFHVGSGPWFQCASAATDSWTFTEPYDDQEVQTVCAPTGYWWQFFFRYNPNNPSDQASYERISTTACGVHPIVWGTPASFPGSGPVTLAPDGYPLHSGTPNRLWFGNQSALADSMIDR